jgi:hypothetical protein
MMGALSSKEPGRKSSRKVQQDGSRLRGLAGLSRRLINLLNLSPVWSGRPQEGVPVWQIRLRRGDRP